MPCASHKRIGNILKSSFADEFWFRIGMALLGALIGLVLAFILIFFDATGHAPARLAGAAAIAGAITGAIVPATIEHAAPAAMQFVAGFFGAAGGIDIHTPGQPKWLLGFFIFGAVFFFAFALW